MALSLQEDLLKLLELSGQSKMSTLVDALYAGESHRPSRVKREPEEEIGAQQHLRQNAAEVLPLKNKVDACLGQLKYNDDKLLVADLCRLLADRSLFVPELYETVSPLSLAGYRLLNQSASQIKNHLRAKAKGWFHRLDFQVWREKSFKEYLREKRKEERESKRYAKPYTDYLEQIEKKMFTTFWDAHGEQLFHLFILGQSADFEADPSLVPYFAETLRLRKENAELTAHAETVRNAIGALPIPLQNRFLKTLRSFEELDRPLYGRYRSLRHVKGVQFERHLAAAFYPLSGYGYGRSQAFRQSTPQGSVFKIVVAYQGLLERFQKLKELEREIDALNPLTLTDDLKWHAKAGSLDQILGYSLDGQPITRMYKGGKLPRSHPNIGKIGIEGAIEQSSNIYFSILAADQLADPLNLVEAARQFGFGEKTGIELPGEIAGSLPDDVTHNRTGLYAFAIGQHSLVVTPLQTTVMLGTIANQGHVLKPRIVQVIAGQEPLREYRDPFSQAVYPFKDQLSSIGIHFPLFTSTQSEITNPYIWYSAPEVKRELFMPDILRDPLIKGMHRVITGPKGTARPSIIRALAYNPEWMRDFQEIKKELIGKTGTAEILYKQTIDSESEAKIQNHIWFGGVAFEREELQSWENPDLVVVVYLRFSEAGGKEAAPLAAEIVKKWKEIRQEHGRSSHILPNENAQE